MTDAFMFPRHVNIRLLDILEPFPMGSSSGSGTARQIAHTQRYQSLAGLTAAAVRLRPFLLELQSISKLLMKSPWRPAVSPLPSRRRLREGANLGEALETRETAGPNLGGIDMIRGVLCATLASAALMVGAAQATENIVWWDFLSGGDGVRMKAML